MSNNVALVPLNVQGALELGMHPCEACNEGWEGMYISSTTISSSCRDDCEYIKKYQKIQNNKDDKNLFELIIPEKCPCGIKMYIVKG